MPLQKIIDGKKETLVITGVSSFIGMHLAYDLSPYFNVVGTISQEPKELIRIERINRLKEHQIKIIKLDMTDADQVTSTVLECRPTYWINHAGWVKNYSSLDYDRSYAQKVHLSALPSLFQSLKKVGAKGLIGTGTSMEYSDGDNAHKEDEICSPSTPYGLEKLAQTEMTLNWGKEYSLNAAILRVFIPFGDFDTPQKLLPQLLQSLQNQKKFPLSSGTQVRSFTPVSDLTKMYFKIIKSFEKFSPQSEIYNGCLSEGQSLRNFIEKQVLEKKLDLSLLDFGVLPLRSTEVPFCFSDNQKMLKLWSDYPV